MSAPSRRTWLWVVLAFLGLGVAALIAVAGAGVYFVTRHIKTEPSTSTDAIAAFDAAKARFANQPPLYQLDHDQQPQAVRPLADLPTSATRPDALQMLAWDPEDERLIRISLPFWILRLGERKMELKNGSIDLEQLDLNPAELERIGPALLFDYRDPDGARVLLWTQ